MSLSASQTSTSTNTWNVNDSYNKTFEKINNYDKVGNVYIGGGEDSPLSANVLPYVLGVAAIIGLVVIFKK